MTDTREQVERLAGEMSALATREAAHMPSGWSDAHGIYSDTADLLRSLLSRLEAAEAERDAAIAAAYETAVSVIDAEIKRVQPEMTRRAQRLAEGKKPGFQYTIDRADLSARISCRDKVRALASAAAVAALDRVREKARLEERERCARIVDPAPNAKAGLWAENLRKKAAAIREATT